MESARKARTRHVIVFLIVAFSDLALTLVGHVLKHEREGTPEVSYWVDKERWGKGIATKALADFLGEMTTRPVYARVAKDNAASLRVLEKCGFGLSDEGRGFSNARNEVVTEFVLRLG